MPSGETDATPTSPGICFVPLTCVTTEFMASGSGSGVSQVPLRLRFAEKSREFGMPVILLFLTFFAPFAVRVEVKMI